MKQIFIVVLFLGSLLASCSNGQQNASFLLEPVAFEQKIKETKDAVVLDVRTPGEYSKGHLTDALTEVHLLLLPCVLTVLLRYMN